MTDSWNAVRKGEPRVFGFIIVDIVGSSKLSVSREALNRTIANLKNHLQSVASIYGLTLTSWEGDGGVFAILIDRGDSYDRLAQAALHFRETMASFNRMKGITNLIESPISLRIASHVGIAVPSKDSSPFFHGAGLYALVKAAIPDSVVITEAVYSQLSSQALRQQFAPLPKTWSYEQQGESRVTRLYVLPSPTAPSTTAALPRALPLLSESDLAEAVARAFSKQGATVRLGAILEGLRLDVLIEERSPSGRVTTLVECKSYSQPVGIETIQAVHSRAKGLGPSRVQQALVVSATGFTPEARIVAETQGVQLMSLDDLLHRFGPTESLPPLPSDAYHRHDLSQRAAFVVMPFKKELYDVYYFGIRLPLEREGYIVERVDEIQFLGGVMDKIVASIKNADLIVGEITDQNPNVYYEIGFAHALGKSVILLTRSIENVPFDLRGLRLLTYETIHELVPRLQALISSLK